MFEIYKPGQGFWLRIFIACILGLIALFTGFHLRDLVLHFSSAEGAESKSSAENFLLKYFLPIAISFGFGYGVFWVCGKNAACVDFLVSTDAEMWKVSWPSRAEIVSSTKSVLLFMAILALYIFGWDYLLQNVMAAIGIMGELNGE